MLLRFPRLPLSFLVLMAILALSAQASAQMNSIFSNIFTEILDVRLQRSGSPGLHGKHFVQSADVANSTLVPGLNGLVTGNVASVPIASTSNGVLFDFSSGIPVRVTESLGPILAETARSIGLGKLLVEANFTSMALDRFRGMATEDMRFTFTHQDVTSNGLLGDNPNESDLIDLVMGLNTQLNIGALIATYGVTNELDVSVAVPFVNIRMSGTAVATIQSYTFPRGAAHHIFGGDTLNPVLTTSIPYDQSASGIGDVALRVKYNLARGKSLEFAALGDVRIPTGKASEFSGSGKPTYRLWAVLSGHVGDANPHLNVGYAVKPAEYQSDALEFRGGLDTKISSEVTLAVDFLGQIDVNADEAIHLAPGSVTITDLVPGGKSTRTVRLSNIPDRENDNIFSLAAGVRFAPTDALIVFVNILAPLNTAGLRASVMPTVGASIRL